MNNDTSVTLTVTLSVTLSLPEGCDAQQAFAAWLESRNEQAERGCDPVFVFDETGEVLHEAAVTSVQLQA